MKILKWKKLSTILAIIFLALSLSACYIYPAQPDQPGQPGAWVPGHYDTYGGWDPGHWSY